MLNVNSTPGAMDGEHTVTDPELIGQARQYFADHDLALPVSISKRAGLSKRSPLVAMEWSRAVAIASK